MFLLHSVIITLKAWYFFQTPFIRLVRLKLFPVTSGRTLAVNVSYQQSKGRLPYCQPRVLLPQRDVPGRGGGDGQGGSLTRQQSEVVTDVMIGGDWQARRQISCPPLPPPPPTVWKITPGDIGLTVIQHQVGGDASDHHWLITPLRGLIPPAALCPWSLIRGRPTRTPRSCQSLIALHSF